MTIAAGNLNIIYLLNPEIDTHHIPDMYIEGIEQFFYRKTLALIIKGKDKVHGEYVLSIHPGDKECDEATVKELHMKMFN